MSKIRNALAAGAMGASALIVPVTMPAQLANAEPVAGTVSVTAVLASSAAPCDSRKNPAKCRARHGNHHEGIGDGIGDSLGPDSITSRRRGND
ncbi:hypothetical protein AB0B45_08820 [Nonomuraea sp. NPDC049152]|uniref:hypothetical protein n=1 Tax=Nonomuraea sp. NPDC049152 TaxID=3154350 RepID=UPI0033DFA12B